ncbi:hypothetical protein FRC01_002498, partial [Tulasnella sp. 417]
MSLTSFSADDDGWRPNERRSSNPNIPGPGEIVYAKVSVSYAVQNTSKLRNNFPGCSTRKEGQSQKEDQEKGWMTVATGSNQGRDRGNAQTSIPKPPQKSSTLASDTPEQRPTERPCLVVFTCEQGTELTYIVAPLTRLDACTPEQSTLSKVLGFYRMIYPVTGESCFKIPYGPCGDFLWQKLLPIPGWKDGSGKQYCLLGALIKVKSQDARPDIQGRRLQEDVLPKVQREAMSLMKSLERDRLHI